MKVILQRSWKLLLCLGFIFFLLETQAAHAATSIESGETLSGSLAVSEMDIYEFYGEEGDRILIGVDLTWGQYGFNTEICLIDPDWSDEVACQTEDLLDHVLEKTGTYAILVQDAGLDHTGSYNITLINLMAGPLTSSGDPDGGPIASGETLSGTITVSDIDVFQFYGEAGDRVLIDVDLTGGQYGFNTEICLIASDWSDEVACQTEDLLDHVLEKTGTYAILVQDAGLDHTGSYNITLLKLAGAPSSLGDSDGGLINPAETLSGALAVSDMDTFQFYGEAGDRVLIDVDLTGGQYGFNTEVCLIDPDWFHEVPCQTEDRLDHYLLKSGLYTIVVQDSGFDHQGSYNITLNKLPEIIRPGIYHPDPAGTFDVSNDPTLTWNEVEEASGYDVFFGTNVLGPLQKVGDNVPSPNFPLTDLNYGTVYYWTVVAHTPAGEIPGTVNWFVTHYYIMELTAGWSMISLPVVSESLVLKDVFSGAEVVYGYERNAGYVRVKPNQKLEVGKGYWILLNEPQTYALTGSFIHEHTGSVEDGWYMIGGCTQTAKVIPHACDIDIIYGFEKGSGYQRVTDYLERGKGYWILIKNAPDATISVEAVD